MYIDLVYFLQMDEQIYTYMYINFYLQAVHGFAVMKWFNILNNNGDAVAIYVSSAHTGSPHPSPDISYNTLPWWYLKMQWRKYTDFTSAGPTLSLAGPVQGHIT